MPATAHPPLQLWLPALTRFDAAHPLRQWLRRGDAMVPGPAGELAGLDGYFACDAQPLPAAALTRDLLAGDGGSQVWLSADPAWVQPDLNGARLLACGGLQLTAADARALADSLQPVFDEAGMTLETTTPDRWHLRLPAGTTLPAFVAPEQALGEDLLQHLPQGQEGRRWRVLLNDIQVLLHQHPLNRERAAKSLAPVNSVWLWGGGALPSWVHSELAGVLGDDPLLLALAARAGIETQPCTPARVAAARAGWLVDLHNLTADQLTVHWWPVIETLARRHPLSVHFLSGECWRLRPWHRWRVWRGADA
jgi:hypothetical protein